MNLVMLDIDGTLTQTFEHDSKIFGLAIAEALGCPSFEMDLNGYVDKTSAGVTAEAIRNFNGREPRISEILRVKNKVLQNFKKMYRESSKTITEVPGASRFMEQLRQLERMGIAIATGCWYKEAMFKLRVSHLTVNGIPLATSDDDRNRMRIMEIAAGRARDFYDCSKFERVVYLGDGSWDLQASRDLGYSFIGIGSRIQALMEQENLGWYQDFLEGEAVLASIAKELML